MKWNIPDRVEQLITLSNPVSELLLGKCSGEAILRKQDSLFLNNRKLFGFPVI